MVTCRVCGELLERRGTPPVSCLACETPYHIDCWSYNGSRCGVYGCRGLRAIAGRPSAPPPGAPPPLLVEIGHLSHVWHRGPRPLLGAAGRLAVVALLVGVALNVPLLGVAAAYPAAWIMQGLLSGTSWLRSVEVEDDRMTFAYLLSETQVRWRDVVRGPGRPGAGGWDSEMLLVTGDVVSLPVGEPGFDAVLERAETGVIRDEIERAPVFIGE